MPSCRLLQDPHQTTCVNRSSLSMLGAVDEFERALILERQREGIALARQRGAYAGRKRALTDESGRGGRGKGPLDPPVRLLTRQ